MVNVRKPAGLHYPAQAVTSVRGVAARRIPVPGQPGYTRHVTVPIQNAQQQATVNGSGAATVQLGPSGIGCRWVPAMAVIQTTTGAADNSTCAVFLGPLPLGPQVGGQSYAGGGDSIGLPGTSLQPGEFVWAVWSGAVPGAIATLNVYGDQTVLDTR